MKITAIETVQIASHPNLIYVRVHVDEGMIGLGETFFGANAVAAWVHETAAPWLLGKNPLEIERHWQALEGFVGFGGTGVENRGRSALDIALVDLLGQVAGLPMYQLLGGLCRPAIPVYNTCAGPQYVQHLPETPGLPVSNWGTPVSDSPYNDLVAFMTDAGALAKELVDQGFTGMKIWPFDPQAEVSGGHHIGPGELREGLRPFEAIRNAVGDKIEVMAEMHSMWDLPAALKIARALEEFEVTWIEDPLRMSDLDALRRFKEGTRLPVAASETLATRRSFKDLLEARAVDIVIFDPTWAGGVTEGRKIAAMAETYSLPVAPHDCMGPVELAVAVHLSVSSPNVILQEVVRAFYTGWYRELVTELPEMRAGTIRPLDAPGLGTRLLPEVLERPDATIRTSVL